MKTRGQAALEFLTTYGWAFLVILVMIGAITYFGILNPSKFLPARCTISPEMTCTDYKIDAATGRVYLQLQQGVGKTIYLNNMTCTYEGTTFAADNNPVPASPLAWSPRITLSLNCTNSTIGLLTGRKAKVSFDINYQTSYGGLVHTASGEVYSQVQ